MLQNLKIKNFAIIEDITIDFFDKMTALTGKTGAGKSLLIDCIGLLLGNRADNTYIRNDCDKAIVIGEFSYDNPNIDQFLKDYDIKKLNNLIIYREINKNGKNVIKINNVNSSLVALKNLSKYIADIHLQFDTQKLINPENYLNIIDNLNDENLKILSDYQILLFNYEESLKKYNDIITKSKALNEKIDLYKFQYNELKSYNLENNCINILEEKINKLKNHDKIYQGLLNVINLFSDDSLNNIYQILQEIKKIKDFDNNYNEIFDKLENDYYDILDVKDFFMKEFKNIDFDPNILESYQERFFELKNLEKKYNKKIEDLIIYMDKIKFEIDINDDFSNILSKALLELEKNYNMLINKGLELQEKRKQTAIILETEIKKELNELLLPNVLFKVSFLESKYKDCLDNSNIYVDGLDKIDFLIQLNKGEALKPLCKTASGGELSRIMLVIKSIICKKSHIPLMVFDEIDTGVSGEVALKIALKMKEISNYSQVLAISHLPIVAAIANNQLHVFKKEENNRTVFDFKYLVEDERIIEISKMISGDNINKYSLEIAKQLMKTA